MKKSILILSFLFIIKIGYTQNSDYRKNEISLGISNLTEAPKNQDILFRNSYYLAPFSHITYKRFISERNVLRLTYYRPINKSYDKSGGDFFREGRYKEQFLKIGYEYRFKPKKLIPYIAVDITYFKSSSSNGEGGGIVGGFNEIVRKTTGFGLSPSLGVNYKIYKQFIVGIESNLNILFVEENKTTTSAATFSDPTTISTDKNNFSEYLYNPIVFMVAFTF